MVLLPLHDIDLMMQASMLKASGRKRRGKIFRLCQDGEFVEGDDNILNFATSFYKELFGPVRLMLATLSRPLDKDLEDSDRDKLVEKFTLNEIKEVVFSMKHNRAPAQTASLSNFFKSFGTW